MSLGPLAATDCLSLIAVSEVMGTHRPTMFEPWCEPDQVTSESIEHYPATVHSMLIFE